jgi:hypothetical protein
VLESERVSRRVRPDALGAYGRRGDRIDSKPLTQHFQNPEAKETGHYRDPDQDSAPCRTHVRVLPPYQNG